MSGTGFFEPLLPGWRSLRFTGRAAVACLCHAYAPSRPETPANDT